MGDIDSQVAGLHVFWIRLLPSFILTSSKLTAKEMFDREKAPPLPKNQMGFLQFVAA